MRFTVNYEGQGAKSVPELEFSKFDLQPYFIFCASCWFVVAVIVSDAMAVIVVFTRPQRFKLPLQVRGKSRAEFTNVLNSFQTALRQVRGKSIAEFTKVSKSFQET